MTVILACVSETFGFVTLSLIMGANDKTIVTNDSAFDGEVN